VDNWECYFSHTGSEIANLIDELGIKPRLIITNQFNKNVIDSRLLKNNLLYCNNKDELYEKIKLNDIVTLHGWMKIVPRFICEKYNIYNGHPGNIQRYDDLKGKDPQVRCYEGYINNIYKYAGCVIHKVTEVLDGGEIILSQEYIIPNSISEDEFNNIQKTIMLHNWINFFKNKLYE
jgi:folate-dependent phosphoribosylglycinamide formyltransferase PurN